MEWYYSIARDARCRPWRKLLSRLFRFARIICWHLNQRTSRLFLVTAMLDDILSVDDVE